mmetsp:Transcript_16302/g.35637  ORF Transcript_16302/g.35637 Transcript_16302/m.35637 type:complete len:308 (-) Transcript_16302:164-1087(-)
MNDLLSRPRKTSRVAGEIHLRLAADGRFEGVQSQVFSRVLQVQREVHGSSNTLLELTLKELQQHLCASGRHDVAPKAHAHTWIHQPWGDWAVLARWEKRQQPLQQHQSTCCVHWSSTCVEEVPVVVQFLQRFERSTQGPQPLLEKDGIVLQNPGAGPPSGDDFAPEREVCEEAGQVADAETDESARVVALRLCSPNALTIHGRESLRTKANAPKFLLDSFHSVVSRVQVGNINLVYQGPSSPPRLSIKLFGFLIAERCAIVVPDGAASAAPCPVSKVCTDKGPRPQDSASGEEKSGSQEYYHNKLWL